MHYHTMVATILPIIRPIILPIIILIILLIIHPIILPTTVAIIPRMAAIMAIQDLIMDDSPEGWFN